jgi:hypothetical protein
MLDFSAGVRAPRAASMVRVLVRISLLGLCAALLGPMPAAAVGIIDPAGQDLGGLVDVAPVTAALSLAQTFTPGLSGELGSVSLSMGEDPRAIPSDTLLVQVQATTGGLPAGPILATATLRPADVPAIIPDSPLVLVTFDPPAVVAAGTTYAIVVTTRETSSPYILTTTDEPYAGGQLLLDRGSGWTTLEASSWEGFALRFQTLLTRARGTDPYPTGYYAFGAYAMCDFEDGTRSLCPDQQHPYVPCYLSDWRTVLCPDRDVG